MPFDKTTGKTIQNQPTGRLTMTTKKYSFDN